jgi:hypothetical protein
VIMVAIAEIAVRLREEGGSDALETLTSFQY